jgi:ubiquinone/menaquinone biosynthesis C-methylase UbiE
MTDVIPVIAEAFSRTAAKYDAFAEDHPHLTRLREKVYAHVGRHVLSGSRILELNAGTGIDAVALAQRGYRVCATDISPGMLSRARQKVERLGLQEQVEIRERSFTDVTGVEGAPFDAVFSNLGGLNCIPDLGPVIEQLPHLLRPGGVVTWVLMPPVCLWELAEVFRGNFRLAFRRLPGRTRSHLEGLYFDVYYFSPQSVQSLFGRAFTRLDLEGLSVLTPTAESKTIAKRFPRLYAALARLDDILSTRPPWQGWGDFYILTMRYQPKVD